MLQTTLSFPFSFTMVAFDFSSASLTPMSSSPPVDRWLYSFYKTWKYFCKYFTADTNCIGMLLDFLNFVII